MSDEKNNDDVTENVAVNAEITNEGTANLSSPKKPVSVFRSVLKVFFISILVLFQLVIVVGGYYFYTTTEGLNDEIDRIDRELKFQIESSILEIESPAIWLFTRSRDDESKYQEGTEGFYISLKEVERQGNEKWLITGELKNHRYEYINRVELAFWIGQFYSEDYRSATFTERQSMVKDDYKAATHYSETIVELLNISAGEVVEFEVEVQIPPDALFTEVMRMEERNKTIRW